MVAAGLMLAMSCGLALAQSGVSTYALDHGKATDAQIRQATKWAVDGTEALLTPSLETFFGQTTGRYLADADAFPKANGQPLVVAQVLRVFGDMKLNDFTTTSGYRVLVSAESHNAEYRTYVVTLGLSTQIVAVGMVYFNCPPGGYTPTAGLFKGDHLKCERDPSLAIFYRENSLGQVTRIPEVERAVRADVTATLDGYDRRLSEDGRHYHLKVRVRGVKGSGYGSVR
jgi:hypothetical protein